MWRDKSRNKELLLHVWSKGAARRQAARGSCDILRDGPEIKAKEIAP
jgi:hypothetical protein